MANIFKFLIIISVAFFESFMITTGTWIEYIDFSFVLLLTFCIQTFGLAEFFSFLIAGFILESVSIAPFGVYTFVVGLSVVLGRMLFSTVFTQRSLYSLSLFCISLSSIFCVILFVVKSLSNISYNENFSLLYQHLFLKIFLDFIVLFALLIFHARKTGKQYLTL